MLHCVLCYYFTDEEEHHGFSVGAIIGIIVGVLLVLLFLSPFIGSSLKSCYKNCIKNWFTNDKVSTHPTATTNPGSKVSESRGGHSLALSTSEAEPSTFESTTYSKTQSHSSGVTKDAPPKYDDVLKPSKQNDSTL